MATLICCLSTGKGTWLKVMDVIKNHHWDKIFLVTNEFGKEKFRAEKPSEFLIIDNEADVKSIMKQIKNNLQNRIHDFEVALNIDSGPGKEHMALISALVQLGLSIRFVSVENNRLVEITPYDN